MATIKQVAQVAGVSFTTVSHVINDTRSVSAAVRVFAAIAQLHYVPSALARSLKSQRTGTIGLIVPNHTNPYFSEVARGIEDRCYRAGYSVILCNFGDDAARQRNYLNVLLGKRCDGLIMAALAPADGELLHMKKIPVVLLDRAPRGQSFDVVDIDNVAGGALAVQHLLALGRRRFACMGGPAEIALSRLRIDGVREKLAGAGLSLAPALCRHADFASMGGYQQARALLALPAVQRPDAIFAATT